jgi:hypothetical protein
LVNLVLMKNYKSTIPIIFLFFTSCVEVALGQTIQEVKNKITKMESISSELVDEQLNGYNAKDIEKFLHPYSDSVRIVQFPNTLRYSGKLIMRERYQKLFNANPKLRCEIVARIVYGNKIIDRERITGFDKSGGFPDDWVMDALVTYTISNNLITEVCFVNQLD